MTLFPNVDFLQVPLGFDQSTEAPVAVVKNSAMPWEETIVGSSLQVGNCCHMPYYFYFLLSFPIMSGRKILSFLLFNSSNCTFFSKTEMLNIV